MTRIRTASILAGVGILSLLALSRSVAPVAAQGAGAPAAPPGAIMPVDPNYKPTGPVPRMPDGKPDLSGTWWQGADIFGGNVQRPAGAAQRTGLSYQSLYRPEVAAQIKARGLSDKDDPSLNCLPEVDGPQLSDVFQIVQTPKWIVYMQETFHGFRLIPLDGRPHNEEAPPSFHGDSTAHWEGDTLVVDVTNFNTRNWIFYGVNGPPSIHSDALHVVERIRRTAGNTLEVDRTYEDPKMLTKPWVRPKKVYMTAPFDRIMELVCTVNDTGALMNSAAQKGLAPTPR
jgi:hypothetical protein